MAARTFPFHFQSRAALSVPVDTAFAYLDDFRKLSAHMEGSSGMMLGSKMEIETDNALGRAVGSHVWMRGVVLGMTLALEEVVTERAPPHRKVWETVGARLIVIGEYRLGFELERAGAASVVRVFIDYDLPATQPARFFGTLFAKTYARWCTERMTSDAVKYFSSADRSPQAI
jgi:hypothetical protein